MADMDRARGLIFDCDGVLGDTERYGHLPAFNQTFREFGLPVQWSEEEYAEKLKIGGGKERMASMLTPEFVRAARLPQDPVEQKALLAQWHKRKTEIYKEILRTGRVPGRPGVRRLAGEAAEAGWRLAVASTSAEESVRAVLEIAVGLDLAGRFVVLAGDVVPAKKPAPHIYLLALERLDLPAAAALAVEDSRNGLLAAVGAGLRCLVTLSSYTAEEDMREAALVVSDLGEPGAPLRLVADPTGVRPGGIFTLADAARLIG